MTKQTHLAQVETTPDGDITFRIDKQTFSAEGEITENAIHRCRIAPIVDVLTYLDAVNSDLARQGYPPITATDRDGIIALSAVVWTPAVLAARAPIQKSIAQLIAETNAECQRRILKAYPDWFQRNAANGLETNLVRVAQMKIDIPAMRVESNRLSDIATAGQPYTANWPLGA